MTSMRDRQRRTAMLRAQGMSLPEEALAGPSPLRWEDFSAGYYSAGFGSTIPDNASDGLLDVEVTEKGRLRKMPGIAGIEALSRIPRAVFVHPSLQRTTELLLVAPPYLGIKRGGATQWIAAGLPDDPYWTSTVYGEHLIFTSGSDAMFARKALTDDAPEALLGSAGRVVFVLGSRLFVANAAIDGDLQPLGVVWNAASSLHNDWLGLGSGFELMLSDHGVGDEIVAAGRLSSDAVALIGRYSVWIARLTPDPFRPATFELMLTGGGTRMPYTVQATPLGVVYVSDTGVELFDGRTVTHISDAIDPDIQEMQQDSSVEFRASFDPLRQWYELFTPYNSYVCDLKNNGRWYRKSLIAKACAIFPTQTDPKNIGDLDLTLGEYANPIYQWAGIQGPARKVYVADDALGSESAAGPTYFTQPLTPLWQSPRREAPLLDVVQIYHGLLVTYYGAGDLTVRLRGQDEVWRTVVTKSLPFAASEKTVRISFLESGMGSAVQLVLQSALEIVRFELLTEAQSPQVEGV